MNLDLVVIDAHANRLRRYHGRINTGEWEILAWTDIAEHIEAIRTYRMFPLAATSPEPPRAA